MNRQPAAPPARTFRPRRGRFGRAIAALVAPVALGAGTSPTTTLASPASDPATSTFETPGVFSGTVPDGVCAAAVTVVGGAGGSSISVAGANGGGASISATFVVEPGQSFGGNVGGGGGTAAGAANGGGSGGFVPGNGHRAAGGGGWTQLDLDGGTVVVAGGGGGSAGGHADDGGFGGDGGLISAPGSAPGSNGVAGFQNTDNGLRNGSNASPIRPQGGEGGQPAIAGLGGSNTLDTNLAGFAGSGRNGGDGGLDPENDSGGGGGGGYFGGGGGASSRGFDNQAPGPGRPSGGGGGGGASWLAATGPTGVAPTDVSSIVGPKTTSGVRVAGADGSVTIDWQPCAYDLAVIKSVTPAMPMVGSTVRWTVVVTNDGPEPMAIGDTVTVVDTLPGAGATNVVSVDVTDGGGGAVGTVTCDAVPGNPMSGTVTCSRLNVGETITIIYTQAITETAGTVLTNAATVDDRTPGDSNDTSAATATVIPDGVPTAVDDTVTVIEDTATPIVIDALADNGNGADDLSDNATYLSNSLDTTGTVGTVVDNGDGTFDYTPAPGFAGTDRFDYTICDDDLPTATCSTATVTVTVVGLGAISGVVWHDADADGNVDATEDEVDAVRLDLVGAGLDDVFGTADDTTHDPARTASPYRFDGLPPGRYRVTVDTSSLPASLTTPTHDLDRVHDSETIVTVTSQNTTDHVDFGYVNLVPRPTNIESATDENTAVTISLPGSDVDPEGQQLSVDFVVQPFNGTALLNNDGTITYTPAAGFGGVDVFSYVVCDPGGECSVAAVQVTVRSVTPSPAVVVPQLNVRVGQRPSPLQFSDPGTNGPFEVRVTDGALPQGLTLNPDGTFVGLTNAPGVSTFTVEVCDQAGRCASTSISVNAARTDLPATGTSSGMLARLAIAVLVAGSAILVATRRRSSSHDAEAFG